MFLNFTTLCERSHGEKCRAVSSILVCLTTRYKRESASRDYLPARFAVTTATTVITTAVTPTITTVITAKVAVAGSIATFAWLRFIDFQSAATELFAIELIDSGSGLGVS